MAVYITNKMLKNELLEMTSQIGLSIGFILPSVIQAIQKDAPQEAVLQLRAMEAVMGESGRHYSAMLTSAIATAIAEASTSTLKLD